MSLALALVALLALLLAVVVLVRVVAVVRGRRLTGVVICAWRGRCDPVRHPLGGFRCSVCGIPGGDLGEFAGFEGTGYVAPVRRVNDRDGLASGKTSAWAPTARGRW